MKNVLVIGCGGIGSYFIEHLYKAILNEQVPQEMNVQIVDDDSVEMKNILYQNFSDEDVLKRKAEVLGSRYSLDSKNKRILTDDDLKEFDIFVICADNGKVRKLVYDYCYGNDKFFIDLRAEGRQIAVITSDLHKIQADRTLPKEIKENNGSCQIKFEFEDLGWIQYGNLIVAAMGIQTLVNKIRKELYNPSIIMRV